MAPANISMRRSQQERSALARSKLLAAAIALICERGFGSTTRDDVATRAGMTRGAIQHHFSRRDILVLAILCELERQIVAVFHMTEPKPSDNAVNRVCRLIDGLGIVAQSDAYLAVVDIWMSTRSEAGIREGVRASMTRSFQAYLEVWRRTLDGLVPPAVISECRRMVINTMRGIVISRIFIADAASARLVITTCKKLVSHYLEAQVRVNASAVARLRVVPSQPVQKSDE